MKRWMLSVALVAMTGLAWALPSLQDVETQVKQGHYTQAESMMKEVVAAKPNSARAHYIYAEILAHDGNLSRAADEARLARQIDPDLGFTTPEKFRSFEASLTRAQMPTAKSAVTPSTTSAIAPAAMAPAAQSAGLPSWIWLAGLAVVGFFLWRGFSRSKAAAAGGAMAAPGATFAEPCANPPLPWISCATESRFLTTNVMPLPAWVWRGTAFAPNVGPPHVSRNLLPPPALRSAAVLMGMVSVTRGTTLKFALAVASAVLVVGTLHGLYDEAATQGNRLGVGLLLAVSFGLTLILVARAEPDAPAPAIA